ncbi:VWA domain-containing protein [uncultured Winogradskyella sp.]|uniref:VWA domain-containing protein n=1 Tax=uncultured Winogradskyella sp. TaxID=395353 RepID=UPI002616F0ED|nr:VWA domain-containing protein [uncultured Winogradskyella sp.]
MPKFKISWKTTDDVQLSSNVFRTNGWSIKGALDDDFADSSLNSQRWSIENAPSSGLITGTRNIGDKWYGYLSLGLDDHKQFNNNQRDAVYIHQAAPSSNFSVQVNIKKGYEGILVGTGVMAMLPIPDDRRTGALVINFGQGQYLVHEFLIRRNFDAPSKVITRILEANRERTINEADVFSETISLKIDFDGNRYRCFYSVDGVNFKRLASPSFGLTAKEVGLTGYSGGTTSGYSSIDFSEFRIIPTQAAVGDSEVDFKAYSTNDPSTKWYMNSFQPDTSGQGAIRYQYQVDGMTTFNGQWLTANQIRLLGSIQSQSIKFKVRFLQTPNNNVVLHSISLEGLLNNNIRPPDPISYLSAIAQPGRLHIFFGNTITNPHIISYEVLRRRKGASVFRKIADVDKNWNSFLDQTVEPGGYYQYIVRSINIEKSASSDSAFLTVPSPAGGKIINDQKWQTKYSPYFVMNPIRIEGSISTPAKLTIEPNTVVRFVERSGIIVGNELEGKKGNIQILGTRARPVFLTGAADDSLTTDTPYSIPPPQDISGNRLTVTKGEWPGIYFSPETGANSELRHSVIRFAGSYDETKEQNGAIMISDASVKFLQCRFTESAGAGIDILLNAPKTISLDKCVIESCNDVGLRGEGGPQGQINISNSIIVNNDADGITIKDVKCSIEGTLFRTNRGMGITTTSKFTQVEDSDFDSNEDGAINIGANISQLNLASNWWGDQSGPKNTAHPSGTGQIVLGNAVIQPFRMAPKFSHVKQPPSVTNFYPGARVVTGRALPGHNIFANINGLGYAKTTADINGDFRLFFDEKPPPAFNDWTYIAETPKGESSGAFEIRTDDRPETQPGVKITSPVDGERFNLNSDVSVSVSGVQVNVTIDVFNGAELNRTHLIVNRNTSNETEYTFSTSNTIPISLKAGINTIDVLSHSNDGRLTGSEKISVVLNQNIPDAPQILVPMGTDHRSSNATVPIIGQGTPNSTIVIRDGHNIVGRSLADNFGNFFEQIQLTDGPHIIVAEVIGTTGLMSASSRPVQITIDTTPPRIQITKPYNNIATSVDQITVYGTWESENIQRIIVNGNVAELYDVSKKTVKVNNIDVIVERGYFRAKGVRISQGQNTIKAEAYDTVQNSSDYSVIITKDIMPALVSVLFPPLMAGRFVSNGPLLDIGAQITKPDADVFINGKPVQNTNGTVLAFGNPLALGENQFVIETVDRLGNKGDATFTAIYDPEQLHINAIGPDNVIPGAIVTLTGTGFSRNNIDNRITFNGVSTIALSVNPDRRLITVIVPDQATTGSVTVTVGGNTSNSLYLNIATLNYVRIWPNQSELRTIQGTTKLTVIGTYSNNETRDESHLGTWTTSNSSVATLFQPIAGGGIIFARGEGLTNIGYIHPQNQQDTAHVRVRIPKVSIALVIDKSGSMDTVYSGKTALQHAKEAAEALLSSSSLFPEDRVAMVEFSNTVVAHAFNQDKSTIIDHVRNLTTGGGTQLFDGILGGISLTDTELQSNPGSTGAVLVLADGQDDNTGQTLSQKLDNTRNIILHHFPNIRVYFVFIGPQGIGNHLQTLASQTNSRYQNVIDPTGLNDVFQEILNLARNDPARLEIQPQGHSLEHASLGSGGVKKFNAYGTFRDGRVIDVSDTADLWETTNPNVAIVNTSGQVASRGSGNTTIICVSGGLADRARVFVDSPPKIDSINPPQAIKGAEVTIVGAGFTNILSDILVTFNGVPAIVISADASTIITHVPEGATSGPVIVRVKGQSTNAFSFGVPFAISINKKLLVFPGNKSALAYWESHPGPLTQSGYHIFYRSTSPSYRRSNISPVSGNLYEIGGLQNNQPHTVRIHAVDANFVESIIHADSVLVTPSEYYLDFEIDRVPTWGTASGPHLSGLPEFKVTLEDGQGNPISGQKIHCVSENNELVFNPAFGTTDTNGQVSGFVFVRQNSSINADQLLEVNVFYGPMAEALDSGDLPAAFIPQLSTLETRSHSFDGNRMFFTNRRQNLSAHNPYASKPLKFKLLVLDARKELAMQNFFTRRAGGMDIPGYEVAPPIDIPSFNDLLRQGTRYDQNGVPMPANSFGIDPTNVAKIVADIAASIFIPGWDAKDLIVAGWNLFVHDEEPESWMIILSTLGLAADLAQFGGPLGILGNVGVAIVKGVCKVLHIIDPVLPRWLLKNSDDLMDYIRFVMNRQPNGYGNTLGQVIAISDYVKIIEDLASTTNRLHKIDPIVGDKIIKMVGYISTVKFTDEAIIGVAQVVKRSGGNINAVRGLLTSFPEKSINDVFGMLGKLNKTIPDDSAKALLRMHKVLDEVRGKGDSLHRLQRIIHSAESLSAYSRRYPQYFQGPINSTTFLNDTLATFNRVYERFPHLAGTGKGMDQAIVDLGSGYRKLRGSRAQLEFASSIIAPATVVQFERAIRVGKHRRRIPDLVIKDLANTPSGPQLVERLVEAKHYSFGNIPRNFHEWSDASRLAWLRNSFPYKHMFAQAKDTYEFAKRNNQHYGIIFSGRIPGRGAAGQSHKPPFSDIIKIFQDDVGIPSGWHLNQWLKDAMIT